jgi:organic hydroperoxide reductase OsmC/OhrA
VLRPKVTIDEAEHLHRSEALHQRAHELCFVANSVNFPVRTEPVVSVGRVSPS